MGKEATPGTSQVISLPPFWGCMITRCLARQSLGRGCADVGDGISFSFLSKSFVVLLCCLLIVFVCCVFFFCFISFYPLPYQECLHYISGSCCWHAYFPFPFCLLWLFCFIVFWVSFFKLYVPGLLLFLFNICPCLLLVVSVLPTSSWGQNKMWWWVTCTCTYLYIYIHIHIYLYMICVSYISQTPAYLVGSLLKCLVSSCTFVQ